MSEDEMPLRRLSELVSPVVEPIDGGKDPELPYVGLEHIPSRGTELLGWDRAENSVSTNLRFRRGDVLLGKLRPYLRKCVLAPFDGYCSTDIIVLRACDGVHQGFAAAVLNSEAVGAVAERTAAGTKMPRTSWKELRSTEVFCPAENEQSAIADRLDSVQRAIAATAKKVAKLAAVREGILHNLLTRGIDEKGELRPTAIEAPELYQTSAIGVVPRDWDMQLLEELDANVTSGSRDWARYYSDSGSKFIRIGNLTREHPNLRWDEVMFVRPPQNGEGQRTRLEADDILISITADLGIVGIVPSGLGPAYINQHIAMVRLDRQNVNARFVGHFLSGHRLQAHLARLNDAGAKAGLNLPTIRNLPVSLPRSRDEQNTIAELLDEADAQIAGLKVELSKLKLLKAGLADDLLTGRVRVTPLLVDADAPALEGAS